MSKITSDSFLSPDVLYRLAEFFKFIGANRPAIATYRAALRKRPDFLEVIAAMGELRYNAPPQPYQDILGALYTPNVTQVTVQIRTPCNYRCPYCFATKYVHGHNNEAVQPLLLDKIQAVYEKISARLIISTLDCAGGEPTIHPQMSGLLDIITRYGTITISSNNSQSPTKWLPKENAEKIFLRAALHPEGEATIDKFEEHIRRLLDRGGYAMVIFVAHPERLKKIPHYREMFAKLGVSLVSPIFYGTHDGKQYPAAYTQEELSLIRHEESIKGWWYHKAQPKIERIRNFKGIPCITGYKTLYIIKDGKLARCPFDPREIEAPYESARPCKVNYCACGLFLEKLNLLQDAATLNFYSKLAGKYMPETDPDMIYEKLRGTNSGTFSDIVAREKIAVYDELMRAYGKED